MNMPNGILMEIILVLVYKAGGRVSLSHEEVDAAHEKFEAGTFTYGPQPDSTFLLEFKEPS